MNTPSAGRFILRPLGSEMCFLFLFYRIFHNGNVSERGDFSEAACGISFFRRNISEVKSYAYFLCSQTGKVIAAHCYEFFPYPFP